MRYLIAVLLFANNSIAAEKFYSMGKVMPKSKAYKIVQQNEGAKLYRCVDVTPRQRLVRK